MKNLLRALIFLIFCARVYAQMPPSELEKLLIDKQYELFIKQALDDAKKDSADALFLLGKAYNLGLGVEVDLREAESYYRRAADLGSARAWNNLGFLVYWPDNAVPMFEKALSLGLRTPSTYNLGRAYLDLGRASRNAGTLNLAMTHLKAAYADSPDTATLYKLITASTLASRFSIQASPKVHDALRKEAIYWLKIGVAKDLPMAYQNYGAIYYYENADEQAMPWFQKALDRRVAVLGDRAETKPSQQRRELKDSVIRPGSLPPGQISFDPCGEEVPKPEGLAPSGTPWRIVEMLSPTDAALTKDGIANGKTDERGCVLLTNKDHLELRRALDAGHALALVLYDRTYLLGLEDPVTSENLVLVFDAVLGNWF